MSDNMTLNRPEDDGNASNTPNSTAPTLSDKAMTASSSSTGSEQHGETVNPGISVVIPVTAEASSIADTFRDYKTMLEASGKSFEVIYVIDGDLPNSLNALRELRKAGEDIEIFSFGQAQGEAAALSVGFHHSRGDIVLTLGAEHEVMIEDVPLLLEQLDGTDMVVASRIRSSQGSMSMREGKLERVLGFLLGSSFRDIRCNVRVMRAAVAKELTIYGNQQRFLPLIAQTQGFSVREVEVRSGKAPTRGVMKLDVSIMLDVITIYFLIKFTKKPFRFFGGFGFAVLLVGALITAYLVFMRLGFGVALVDRPALILSSLMVVLGIQIVSVGLIGEIIAFSYAKDVKDYKVERIVE